MVGSLLALLVLLIVRAHLTTIWVFPRAGIDMQIPLDAAERWMAGGLPYEPDGFRPGQNANPPFLYPPVVLPLFAALTAVPRTLVVWGAVLLMAPRPSPPRVACGSRGCGSRSSSPGRHSSRGS